MSCKEWGRTPARACSRPSAAPAATAARAGLKDGHLDVRHSARYALQNVRGDPEIVFPALAKIIKEDKDQGLRQQLVQVLSQYGARAVPLLLETLKDKDDNM